MDLSNLRPAEGSVQSDNFRRGRGHGSGNGKTAGKGPELRDRDLKADRCLYTEDCLREVSLAETPRQSSASTCLHLKYSTMMLLLQ